MDMLIDIGIERAIGIVGIIDIIGIMCIIGKRSTSNVCKAGNCNSQ